MYAAQTDQELLLAFRNRGDEAAYVELTGRWDVRVLSFLRKATGDGEAAKDLRQEVFLRVFRFARTYDAQYAVSTWIWRIVYNTLSTWRSRHRLLRWRESAQDMPTKNAADYRPSPADAASEHERQTRVQEAIEALPAQEKALLLLRFQAGLSFVEISRALEVPETTIKSRMYKTLERLRLPLAELRPETGRA